MDQAFHNALIEITPNNQLQNKVANWSNKS